VSRRPLTQTRLKRRALLAQLQAPMRQFLATEAGSAGLLLCATLLALVWANSPWSGLYDDLWATELGVTLGPWELSMDLAHWVNDGLMALFFFVVGLEVRREFSIGELTDRRRAAIPVAAALGGLTIPAVVYVLLAPADAAHGWGVVIGTDTAFMLGALAVVGPTFATQLRIFLLTLTVIDDIVAVSVIGVFYSDHLDVAGLLAMAALGVALAALSRSGVWRAAPYVALGLGMWLAALHAGLHASIAGMLGGLLVAAHAPAREAVEGAAQRFLAFRQSPMVEVGRSARRGLEQAISVNERLQSVLHPWASYVVVPVFALANAGVELGAIGKVFSEPVGLGIVLGLVLGKPVGIFLASFAAVRLRLGKLPEATTWPMLLGLGAVGGIGFTVSIFIAGLSFPGAELLTEEAKVAILLASLVAAVVGIVVLLAATGRGPGSSSESADGQEHAEAAPSGG
jgi:Na+/H+ antiporter NhaA